MNEQPVTTAPPVPPPPAPAVRPVKAVAPTGSIQEISSDASGIVTVTTNAPHGLVAAQVGDNVSLSAVRNPAYNTDAPTPITSVPSPVKFQVVNLAVSKQAPSSGGTWTLQSLTQQEELAYIAGGLGRIAGEVSGPGVTFKMDVVGMLRRYADRLQRMAKPA